jgi:hypothetical protein
MAAIQGKYSSSRAQGRRSRAHASTKPKVKTRKRRPIPRLPPPKIIKRGKTTIRRYPSRSVHRMEEFQGKVVEAAEVYTAGDYHAIDIRFQDKTTLHFVVDPCFILEIEHADWKTGNWRPIKRWPLIRSQTLRS